MRLEYTHREKVLMKLASQCVWSDPTKKPTKKNWWKAKRDWWATVVIKPTDIMIAILLLIDIAMIYFLHDEEPKFTGIVFMYIMFAILILFGYSKRDQ